MGPTANPAETIIIIARKNDWEQAKATSQYTQSTIDSTLAEVGFIHCSTPDQTIEIANRKYADQDNLVLLFIHVAKVNAPVKFEGARSGRAGIFPHIYGPLNIDAVYKTKALQKEDGTFKLSTPLL